LQVILHREIPEDDGALRRQWNKLVFQMESPEVFYTYEWALAVQRAYRSSMLPLMMLAYERDSLVGVAALATGVTKASAFFLAASTADYCDFVCSPGRRNEFIQAVLAELRKLGMRMLTLANIPADSATARGLQAAAHNQGYYHFARPAYSCARVVMGSSQQRQEIKQSMLPRRKIRRYLQAMQKQGPVTLSHLKNWESIDEALTCFTTAHVARFLILGSVSNLARPARRHFLSQLARLLSDSGWIVLTRLMIAEKPVAWNYGFQFCGSWFWYQPTFDSRLEEFSPGFCLLSKIVSEACDNPEISVVDMGLGAEGYKTRLATSSRQSLHVTLTTSLGRHVHGVTRHRLSTAAKTSPGIEHGIRSVVSRIAPIRQSLRVSGISRFAAWVAKFVWAKLFGCEEVLFYEWCEGGNVNFHQELSRDVNLEDIDLELLAAATMHYVDDRETLDYLLLCVKRVRSGDAQGFALVTDEGVPLQFCWASPFEEFHIAALNMKLTAPSPHAVMLFEFWTPVSRRGRGYYEMTAQLVAEQFRRRCKSIWTFSVASSLSSVRGVEKSGFQRRYSLIRRNILLWHSMSKRTYAVVPIAATEVSVAS
jgi:CelD/BcsL family acetyltransferase involved in cellulose biosynthesis